MTEQQTIEEVIAGLTPKELRFCQLYAHCLNGAKAARDAGYSEESDRYIAHENLTKPHIKQVVKHYLEQAAMPVEEAVKRLTDMGRGSVEHFITEAGDLDLSSDAARENVGLIKKIKQTRRLDLGKRSVDGEGNDKSYEIVNTEIELHDPKDALKVLLEVHGKLIQKIEHYMPPTIEL